jgi:hypothetical protein
MGASSAELRTTRTTAATVPARAKRASSLAITPSRRSVSSAAPHAPIVAIVKTKMLVSCTYHVPRLRSHSGMCWISGISARSAGGTRSTAAIRKTPVVW